MKNNVMCAALVLCGVAFGARLNQWSIQRQLVGYFLQPRMLPHLERPHLMDKLQLPSLINRHEKNEY